MPHLYQQLSRIAGLDKLTPAQHARMLEYIVFWAETQIEAQHGVTVDNFSKEVRDLLDALLAESDIAYHVKSS